MPGLSFAVVIPTFNRRDSVLRAVESALTQEYQPSEVIVVDGHSTDGTVDALRREFGDAVRLFEQPNLGPSPARNRAMAAAQSDVVAFLDSDNRWRPHHLSALLELFDRHPRSVLVGTSRDYLQGVETVADAVFGDVASTLLLERFGVGYLSSVGVRLAPLVDAGGFAADRWYGEDIDMYIQMALRGPFALLSACTLDRGVSVDSLESRGKRSGGYVHFREETGARALETIESLGLDPAELRSAAEGRIAIGRAFRAIAERASPDETRRCFGDAFRFAPERCDRERLERDFEAVVPDWDDLVRRDEAFVLLALAWPRGFDRVGAEVRLGGIASAVRMGDWWAIARLLPRVLTTSSLVPFWHRIVRFFGRREWMEKATLTGRTRP